MRNEARGSDPSDTGSQLCSHGSQADTKQAYMLLAFDGQRNRSLKNAVSVCAYDVDTERPAHARRESRSIPHRSPAGGSRGSVAG